MDENDVIDDFGESVAELDDLDFEPKPENQPTEPPVDNPAGDQHGTQPEEDFITVLLKSKGIEDKSKIKFENEEGDVEELSWDSLSNEERMNIIKDSNPEESTDLDENEIALINHIRESQLSVQEYLDYMQRNAVEQYTQNNSNQVYEVDSLSDDELFIGDFTLRNKDVTEEEAAEYLEQAKQNPDMYAKQVANLRAEYKQMEQQKLQEEQLIQQQQEQQRFEEWSNSIVDEINNFTEFQGYDLDLTEDDAQKLYDFITGTDPAGNNWFSKALADPEILVQTAWLTLNGKEMVSSITDYYKDQITKARKEGYKKGLEAGKQGKVDVVYKPRNSEMDFTDDLD